MAWYRAGGGGIPSSVKTDMNNVLNKKFGTSGQTYPPTEWADDVNLMGMLEVKSTTKSAIAHITDGADDVPISEGTFYIAPSQSGTGTPSPSNPRPIVGYTGMTISHAKNLFLPNPTDSAASTTNGVTRSYSIDTQEFTLSGTNEKTDANWLIANWSNETIVGLKAGATYTFSHNLSNNCYAQITYYDTNGSTKTLVSLTGNASKNASTQFTVPSDFDRPRNFQIGIYRTATTVDEQAHFMIMGGAVTSDFVKYVTPETLPVSWQTEAGTVYGGELKTDGTLTESYAVLSLAVADMNNTESYPGWTNSGIRQYVSAGDVVLNDEITSVGQGYGYNTTGTKDIIYLPKSLYNNMTQTQWQTDYPDLVIQIAVPLATPNEYSLSPISLSTYYGDNNVWCDTGDTQIDYRSTGASEVYREAENLSF